MFTAKALELREQYVFRRECPEWEDEGLARFDEAARHQQQAIKLARERRSTQAQHLAQQLHDYSQGKPCRMPFPPKATIFQRKNY